MPIPLSDDARLTSVWHLSVAFVGSKSRTERPWKTKISTEVAHITRESDTTFKVKGQKSTCRGRGHIVAASRTACSYRKVTLPRRLWCHVCTPNEKSCSHCIGESKLCRFRGRQQREQATRRHSLLTDNVDDAEHESRVRGNCRVTAL